MDTLSPQRQPKKAALAAFIGTTIEWYDFYIYAHAAALVFGGLFFSAATNFVGTMASFATFAVGFVARPVGGIIFGHFGDRLGRKVTLVITLMMMGIATVSVGLLPTYASAGVVAPVLLVLCRLIRGLAVGGEWGGAVLLASEHAPEGKDSYYASFAQLGSPMGLVLSLIAFRLISGMDRYDMLEWGWRVPFLSSAVLLLVGLLIRLGVSESPEFDDVRRRQETARIPIAEVLVRHWKTVLLCIGAGAMGIAGVYFTNTLMISYTTTYLGISSKTILDCLLIVAFFQIAIQLIVVRISRRFGDVRMLKIIATLAIGAPYLMFMLVETRSVPAIILGIAMTTFCTGGFYCLLAGFLAKMFATRIRYTAISMSYQLCGAIFGGITPLMGAFLMHKYHGDWWSLAVFFSALSATSLLCVVLSVGKTFHQPLYSAVGTNVE